MGFRFKGINPILLIIKFGCVPYLPHIHSIAHRHFNVLVFLIVEYRLKNRPCVNGFKLVGFFDVLNKLVISLLCFVIIETSY